MPKPGTESWVTEKDENGEDVKVFRGPQYFCTLPLRQKMDTTQVADSDGFFLSDSEDVKTSYDLTFRRSEFDSRPALGRCVKQQYIQRRCLARWEAQPQASGCGGYGNT